MAGMVEWMQELALLAEAEYHARRVVAALATVDSAGHPHARTVIVRRLDAATPALWITSDARSNKIAQLQACPVAELVFWMPHERLQFRLRGPVEIMRDGPVRQEIWEDLNDAGRAMFSWPPSGQPRREQDFFAQSVAAKTPPPESFVLLVLRPSEAESVELNEFPHRRRRWRKESEWRVEMINP